MSQGVSAMPAGTHTWDRCLRCVPPREAPQTHLEEATQTQTPILPSPWVGHCGEGCGGLCCAGDGDLGTDRASTRGQAWEAASASSSDGASPAGAGGGGALC